MLGAINEEIKEICATSSSNSLLVQYRLNLAYTAHTLIPYMNLENIRMTTRMMYSQGSPIYGPQTRMNHWKLSKLKFLTNLRSAEISLRRDNASIACNIKG